MIASARNLYILKRLNESGIVDYKNIATELAVSEATVRRDFEKLEEQGKLRRVQGGAVRSDGAGAGFDAELSIRAKNSVNIREKALVAAEAAKIVQDGECVYLDVGTSIAPMAQHLLNRAIRIVTCNNLILQRITPESRAEVFIVGGRFLPADQMIVGSLAESMLQNFGFNRAFIGCMGFDVKSNLVYATDMECVKIKQIAIANAEKSYLLADVTKRRKVGLFRVAGLDAFEQVYLNGPSPKDACYPENVTFVEA